MKIYALKRYEEYGSEILYYGTSVKAVLQKFIDDFKKYGSLYDLAYLNDDDKIIRTTFADDLDEDWKNIVLNWNRQDFNKFYNKYDIEHCYIYGIVEIEVLED